MRRNKLLGIILCMVFIAVTATTAYEEFNDKEARTERTKEIEEVDNTNDDELDGILEVHYIDVNQGDCTFIRCGDATLLIDAGNNGYGSKVRRYLEELGVEELDYVIGTHPDADHIGGLDVVIYNFECGDIFMPDLAKDTKTYEDVLNTVENKNYEIQIPEVGTEYELGEATFTIIAPLHYDYEDNYNNYSIALMVEHGENKFLFTGDCEVEAEADLIESGIDLDADVFKVAHHGSKTANSYEFLQAITPTYCVVSCGEGNPYGHPHAQFMNDARSMGVQLFRTDEQGTVVAYSDGEEITFNMSPSETWKVGE